jgi:hypothetical protein
MQAANHLKQISLAFHSYHDQHGRLPPAVVRDAAGKPLHSWRVLLLPYLEQDVLYLEFHLDEPWDSPHNLALLSRMPKVYGSPEVQPAEPFHTFLQVITGPGTAFDGGKITFPKDIPDGMMNTFLVVEAGEAVPWTKPIDVVYDPNDPIPELGGMFRGGTPWSGWG